MIVLDFPVLYLKLPDLTVVHLFHGNRNHEFFSRKADLLALFRESFKHGSDDIAEILSDEALVDSDLVDVSDLELFQ